jgi:PEP-CTERM motif
VERPRHWVLVVVGGALGLNNTEFGDFTFDPLAGFDDGTYTLFTATSLVGSLGSNLSGPIGLCTGTLSINGNSLILTVVPEPASGALFALGLSTLALRRRRQLTVTSSPASLHVS